MLKRLGIYKWLVALWLIMGYSAPAHAWADRPSAQMQTQVQAQIQSPSRVYSSPYRTTPRYVGSYSTVVASPFGSTAPKYQFRSTSSYTAIVSKTNTFTPIADAPYSSVAQSGPRKGPWDPPSDDDNPIGVVDDPAPIGDTPWLIMLALMAIYIFGKIYRRKLINKQQ